jgi:hypothetical protein
LWNDQRTARAFMNERVAPMIRGKLHLDPMPEDVRRSCEHNANCLITKPVDVDQFLEAVKATESFWLFVVHLPENHGRQRV